MNSATAATTVELHAIGGVEFRLVYTDCLEATCRACRVRPSHGPYWYATWVEDNVPQQCYVGKTLNHEELRQRMKMDGRIKHQAIVDLFSRMDTFERRQADQIEARRKADEERAAVAVREREAERAFAHVRAEAVRKAQERANRARTTRSSPVGSNSTTPDPESRAATAGSPPGRKDRQTTPSHGGSSTTEHTTHATGNRGRNFTASDHQQSHTRSGAGATAASAIGEAWLVLNLPSDSTSEDIKRRYRRLAKELHPDLGGDPDAMKRLNAAFTRLEQAGLVS